MMYLWTMHIHMIQHQIFRLTTTTGTKKLQMSKMKNCLNFNIYTVLNG